MPARVGLAISAVRALQERRDAHVQRAPLVHEGYVDIPQRVTDLERHDIGGQRQHRAYSRINPTGPTANQSDNGIAAEGMSSGTDI